mmetsp:Transcript_12345/g.28962  ORF Transcript_12345/g.28962 Transcript_12345/m.28962 type:complete len:235 (-) Transcript_12345:879-1583(-)
MHSSVSNHCIIVLYSTYRQWRVSKEHSAVHRGVDESVANDQLLPGSGTRSVIAPLVRLKDRSESLQEPGVVPVDLVLSYLATLVVVVAVVASGGIDGVTQTHHNGSLALGRPQKPLVASKKRREAHPQLGREIPENPKGIHPHVVTQRVAKSVHGNQRRVGPEGNLHNALAIPNGGHLRVDTTNISTGVPKHAVDPVQDDPDIAVLFGERFEDRLGLGRNVPDRPQVVADHREL